MRVTLKDIASRANVSKQAVSAALRGLPSTSRVSPALRERILRTAHELGYQPNLLARALAEQRTGLFVTTCDGLRDPHYVETVLAVEQEVRAAGFATCVLRPELDRPEADLLLYQMADAVLHLVSPNRAERAVIETASLAPCIVVAVPYEPGVAIPQYYWDEADGARDIAAHLAERGHRSVAILAGGRTGEAGGVPERVHLLVEALQQARVQAIPIWDEVETDPVAQGSAGLARAVTEHPEATAVIGRNDRFTLGAYLECLRRRIPIPGQISLLSFVDTVLLTTAAPFITAVRSPLRDAAVEAARTLIRHVSEGAPLEPSRKWRPTLEVRHSTG
jgi:LacI family transcriptional regulator, galactose operon repressor